MICEYSVPAGITKFSHSLLATLVAGFLSVAPDEVGISAKWSDGSGFEGVPETVFVEVPDAVTKTCQQIGQHVRNNYDPTESDREQGRRQRKQNVDAFMRSLATTDGSLLKEIVDRLNALEGN